MNLLTEGKSTAMASLQRLLHMAVGSLSRRDIEAIKTWISENPGCDELCRICLLKELDDAMLKPALPKQNVIYVLHEVLHNLKTIETSLWHDIIHQILDCCAPLVSYSHREKISKRVLKYWLRMKFITEFDVQKWTAVLSDTGADVIYSASPTASQNVSSEEKEALLRYTVELIGLIYDSGNNASASSCESSASALTSGQSRQSLPTGGPPQSAAGGLASAARYDGNRPPLPPGSSGHTYNNPGMSSGQHSNYLVGGASTGGPISIMSRTNTGPHEELGISRSFNMQRAKLAVTLSSCWILHNFFSHPICYSVKDLKCLSFGAILLAGKSESYFVRISKILDNASILHQRLNLAADTTGSVSSNGLTRNPFPYCTGHVTSAEKYLLTAMRYDCSLISRPDQVFEKWRHIPNVLDIDILNIAQSRLQGDAHWLHGKLIMYDETVIALGYAVVVALEKSTIQLSEPDTFITSNYFKAVLQVQADSVADFIMNLDTCLQKLKENALKYIARIKEDSPFSRSLEVAERKHSVKLQNFCVDRYFYHHLEDKLKIGAEIRRLFMGCSYCIHVSKIFKCTTCTDDCGCYTLSFENEYQVAKALEMNGTEYQSKKLTVERLLPDVFKDPRRNSHIPDTALDNIIDIKRQSKRLSLSDHNPESTPISSALESESLVSDIGDGTDSYGFDMNKFRYLRVEDWSTETKISIISFTPNQEWKAIAAKLRPLIFCEISSEELCTRFGLRWPQLKLLLSIRNQKLLVCNSSSSISSLIMQDLIDDMSNIEVVVAKLRQPSVEEPVKDITHSDKYIVNSNESEKLPESGHILKKHADLRDLNKREPSGKGFELSRYDNWRDVDKWSNEEKALILDHTPMHIWRNIAGDLLSFRTECKKNRSRCTRQAILERFSIHPAQWEILVNWIKLDIPIRWELNEREITDVKESVENLAGIIDRLKRGHNVRDYKNFATPEILRSPALSRSRDENDKSVSKYNSKDDFKMDRSTASSQPNGIIPKSNVQDIKSKSELFWKDLGYELEQEIRQSYYKYAPTDVAQRFNITIRQVYYFLEKAKISVHPDDILSENALHRLVHALCGGYNEDVKSMQYDDELLIRYRSCDDSRTKGPRHVDRRRESSARAERDIVDDNFQVYSKSDRRNERSSSEAVGEGNFNNIYGFSIRRRDEKLINSPCSVNLLEAKQRHKHMKIENRPVPTVSIVASHAQEVDLSINRSQNCRSGENIQTSAKSRRDASLDYTNPLHRNDHSIILEDRSGADFNAGESTFNFDRGDNLRNERDNYENKRLKSASQKEIMGKSNCVA